MGRSSNCFGLVPGQQLEAIALADPFDYGLPVGELLSEGGRGSIDTSIASLVQPAYRPSTGSAQLRTVVHAMAA
jgi:hypothetical protein